jgi:hypothetical protein
MHKEPAGTTCNDDDVLQRRHNAVHSVAATNYLYTAHATAAAAAVLRAVVKLTSLSIFSRWATWSVFPVFARITDTGAHLCCAFVLLDACMKLLERFASVVLMFIKGGCVCITV